MELRQLRYFVAIAAAGSLSKASESLRVAQPALSLQLASLEAELGTKLFERNSRGVKLTPNGSLLLTHAASIMKGVEEATKSVGRNPGYAEGIVSIGLPTTVSNTFIGTLLSRVAIELPGIRLRISEHNTAVLSDLLGEGALDLAVLMNEPDHAAMQMQPLLVESYCLVSRLGEADPDLPITWDELITMPLVLPSAGSLLRIVIEDTALQTGRSIDMRAELNSARLMHAAVQSGIGHAILPRSNIGDGRTEGLVARTIVDPEIKSLLQLASSTIRPTLPAQTAVRDVLIDQIRQSVIECDWMAELHSSMRR